MYLNIYMYLNMHYEISHIYKIIFLRIFSRNEKINLVINDNPSSILLYEYYIKI